MHLHLRALTSTDLPLHSPPPYIYRSTSHLRITLSLLHIHPLFLSFYTSFRQCWTITCLALGPTVVSFLFSKRVGASGLSSQPFCCFFVGDSVTMIPVRAQKLQHVENGIIVGIIWIEQLPPKGHVRVGFQGNRWANASGFLETSTCPKRVSIN